MSDVRDSLPPNIVEPSDRAALDHGYTLGWLVDPDGQRWPLIIDDRVTDPFPMPYGVSLEQLAPHELTGPLPAWCRYRLGATCGAPTSAGAPCRRLVHEPGDRCHQHAHKGVAT